MTPRTCRVCGTDLSYAPGKPGRPPVICRGCRKDEIAAKQRAYREQNKDEIAAKQRAYYEQNKDEIAAEVAALLADQPCTELEAVDALPFAPRKITAEIDRLYESGAIDFDLATGRYKARIAA